MQATFARTLPRTLTLSFDRAIDVSGLFRAAFVLEDFQVLKRRFSASGATTMLDPQTVRLTLTTGVTVLGSGVILNVGASNGIVAVGDGAAWGGVSNLTLPFP